MTRRCVAIAVVLLLPILPRVEAQESAGYFTNVTASGGNIRFDVVTPAPPGEWSLQAANSMTGLWEPVAGVPPSPPNPVIFPVDRPERYFRIAWNGWFSANFAGYNRLSFASGSYSMIANHFNQGSNTLAEVLPAVSDSSLIYKFDAVRQVWISVSQFRFGSWDQPDKTLAPGEGAFFRSPTAQQMTLAGTIQPLTPFPQLLGGFNIVSLPIPRVTPLLQADGDVIYRFNTSTFSVWVRSNGGWMPSEPSFNLGESFWYLKNSPPQNPAPRQGSVYFNTYPWSGPMTFDGNALEGTNYVAQLWAGTNPNESALAPVGDPLPFLSGAGAGYMDVRDGGVRYIPGVLPGENAFVQVRYWDLRTGATWQQASSSGQTVGKSAVISKSTGGVGSPPSLPADLNGIIPLPSSVRLDPTNQVARVGERASIRAFVERGVLTPFYQWQKANGTNWTDIPGATSDQLVIDPVVVDSAGSYRVKITNMQGLLSGPSTLGVLVLSLATTPRINSQAGAFEFTLSGTSDYDYTVEVSTNLINWSMFTTISQPSGPVQIPDSSASNYVGRYFRVKGSRH